MKLGKHPHLQAEKLLHLLRLLGIKSTIKPLTSVAISVAGVCGYTYPGRLMYKGQPLGDGPIRRPLIFMSPTTILGSPRPRK